MPAIATESSLRLRLLNFPLIVGVVYIHAYGATIDHAGRTYGPEQLGAFTDFVRILISQGLARLAVPMFFLMSGYFFFLGFTWSWREYGRKLAARVKTLLLPYLFWTVLGVAIRFLGQSFSPVKPYFVGEGPLLADFSAFELVNAVFGFTAAPLSYHFWFIRDLMLLVILSPVVILILRYAAIPFLGAVFLAWISATWPMYIPDAVGVLFFSAGGYLAMHGRSRFVLDRYGAGVLLAYLPVLLADVIWYEASFNLCLHRCGIVVGLVATLFITKRVVASEKLKITLLRLGESSFFVYAAHEPLLGLARTLAFQVFSFDWPYTMLLLYLFIPMLVIAGLVAVHTLLGACCPKALGQITGGR